MRGCMQVGAGALDGFVARVLQQPGVKLGVCQCGSDAVAVVGEEAQRDLGRAGCFEELDYAL